MKNRFAKMLAGVLVTFGLLIQPGTSHAADAVLRDQRANHLLVAPGTAGSGATSRSTNVAEFRSLSGTNKFPECAVKL